MNFFLTVAAACCLVASIAGQAANICASTPVNGRNSFRNPTDCTQFTLCLGTTPNIVHCAPGLHFSAALGQCDVIAAAQCFPDVGDGGGGGGGGGADNSVCSIDINYELVASSTRCDQYTVCACGHAHLETCAPNLVYDTRSQRCDVATAARCVTDPRNSPICSRVGFVAHPNDCRHHFLCVGAGTIPILQTCAPGLNFNPVNNQCDVVRCNLSPPVTDLLPRSARSCKV